MDLPIFYPKIVKMDPPPFRSKIKRMDRLDDYEYILEQPNPSSNNFKFESEVFNPIKTGFEFYKKFKKIESSEKPIDIGTNYIITLGEMSLIDLSQIINIFVIRGSKWDKIRHDCSEEGKKMIEWLIQKYGIQTPSETIPNSEVLTPYRIAATFPEITAFNFMLQPNIIAPLDEYKLGKIPIYIFAPMVASVIPHSAVEPIHHLLIWISFVNDKMIHSKNEKYTSIDRLVKYHIDYYQSEVLTEEKRTVVSALMGLFKLKDEKVKFVKELIEADKKAKKYLIREFPNFNFENELKIESKVLINNKVVDFDKVYTWTEEEDVEFTEEMNFENLSSEVMKSLRKKREWMTVNMICGMSEIVTGLPVL